MYTKRTQPSVRLSKVSCSLDALPPPFTKTVAATGLVNQFSASVAGASWNQSGVSNIWWDPNSGSSTQGVYPNSRVNVTSSVVSPTWTFLLPANPLSSGGGIAGLNISPFNMSGGVITPNTLWGGNWSLGASSQNQTSGSGTWTASLQGSPTTGVPEPSMEVLDLMGGLVMFAGVLGTKRWKKSRT